jgi:cobalt/nickel transport system permease protein
LALLTGGIFSRFTSSAPDGLEWSIQRVSGREELPAPIGGVHGFLAHLGEKTALYPAYAPHKPAAATKTESAPPAATANALPGVVGGVVTLGFTLLVTLALRRRSEAPAVNGTADASGKTSG